MIRDLNFGKKRLMWENMIKHEIHAKLDVVIYPYLF